MSNHDRNVNNDSNSYYVNDLTNNNKISYSSDVTEKNKNPSSIEQSPISESTPYLDFKYLDPLSENILTKTLFESSNKNLLNIQYDNEGIEYTEGYTREKYLNFRRNHREPFRCCPEHPSEQPSRKAFFAKAKRDIFYSYEKFINKLPIHITHFQVRKNFLQFRESEIAYTTETGIQSFNLLNNLKSDLCTYSPADSNESAGLYVICFDICETAEKDFLICYGKSDGSIRILRIKYEELKKIRSNFSKLKNNLFLNNKGNISKTDLLCNEVITVGSSSDEILTNYVKFFAKGKYLLTTANDCYIRIYSLEEKLVLLKSFKSNYAVNHCDFNFGLHNNFENLEADFFNANSSSNLLGAVGDSTFVELFDFHNEKIVSRFKGHYDNSTVLRFIQGREHAFATGNQDLSCKIWDLRKIKNICFNGDEVIEATKTLCANIDSIGDIAVVNRDCIIYCENFDFFNVYNIKHDTLQSVGYVGHFAGVVYQKEFDKIHIAVKERNLNGILSYAGIKNYANSLENLEFY